MAELNTTPEKSGKKVRSKKQAIRVDLTAMVDLAFLLITFFILTTTLAKPKAMNVVMPAEGDPGDQPASRSMTICLGKNNQAVWYLGTAKDPIVPATVAGYGKNGLRRAIANMRKKVFEDTGKTMLVLVKPSERSVYENLVDTIDELTIASIGQYSIADIDAKDISMLRDKRAY